MRYQTGNPVGPDGSSDPRDLYDNAGVIDIWATDRAKRSSPDRLGVDRKTLWGMEQQVNDFLSHQGFEPGFLEYFDGSSLTVDRPTQLISREGFLYSVKRPASFPVELSGDWAADQAVLVAQVDQGFEQAIGGGIRRVDSVSALSGVAGRFDRDLAITAGFHADYAGNGGTLFRWDSSSEAAAFVGMVISPNPGMPGRWLAASTVSVDVAQFGARHGQDIAPALAAAAAWCKTTGQTLTGSGAYTMTAVIVSLRGLTVDLSGINITMVDGSQIVLGNRAQSAAAPRQSLGIVRVDTPILSQIGTIPTVKVIGSKGQTIDVISTNWFQIYASMGVPEDASSAYSTYNLGYVARLDLDTDPAFPTGLQWINENTINVKRVYNNLVIKGSYSHNHNLIITGTFEAASRASIWIDNGNNNLIMAERFEAGPIAVSFSQGTWANVVENTWHSNMRTAYDVTNDSVTVTDNGEGNMVIRNSDFTMRHSEVMSVNPRTCRSFTRNTVNYTSLRGAYASVNGVDDFEITAPFQVLLDTGKMPVLVNDGFQAIMDGTKMRCRWMLYDVNGRELAAVAPPAQIRTDGSTTTISGNAITQGTGFPNSVAIVRSTTVGFLRCQIYGNGATAVGQRFQHIGVRSLTQHLYKNGPQRTSRMSSREPAAPAKPTLGLAEVGDVVQSSTAAATRWLCTFSLETSLSAGMAAGATAITATNSAGVANGDVVGVQLDSGAWHWTTLASAGVLTAGVPTAAGSGNPVVFVRWI